MLRIPLVVVATLSAIVCCTSAEARAAELPNVLVILADDLGFGDLACQGAKDMRTPNLDALAQRGVRFENFYANCPVCSPTRAALMTGRYPDLVGVPGVIRTHSQNSWGYLSPQAVLLPAVLKKRGYETAIVGKWHLGLESPITPTDRGFDHFHGFLGDMMDDYYHHRRHNINYMRLGKKEISPEGHATDLFTDWACEYLKSRQDAKAPFFLYLAYNAPHTPIQPPADWLKRVKDREQDITDHRAKLVALIEHMDDGIGRVLKTLKECGLEENTLVIFTSDNGGDLGPGANNGPWRGGKGMTYEGGLRVPMMAAWPQHIPPGSMAARPALTMDIFPTVCEAAGANFDHEIDGDSILPTLLGQNQPKSKRDDYFVRREGGRQFGGLCIRALRRGDWKLVQNSPFAPLELFNLADDPQEKRDLAKSHAKEFNELQAALMKQIQAAGAIPWQQKD